ncbi:MAG: hypothetical protein ACRYFX_03915 [Janthinobacterium lividum]
MTPLAAQAQPALPVITNVDALLGKPGGIRYLDAYQVTLPGADGARYYDVLQRLDSAGFSWHLRRYALAPRQLVLEQFFTGILPQQVLEGPSREWYASGQLREELAYHKNNFAGMLRTYYPTGKPRRIQTFGGPRTSTCYDSLGQPLAKCPPYHTFATLGGKNTYSGKFLKLVQEQYKKLLPAGYRAPQGLVVYYAFRIDRTGAVREPRVLSPAAPELQTAIVQAIRQLPAFGPASYEGQATDDMLEGAIQVGN